MIPRFLKTSLQRQLLVLSIAHCLATAASRGVIAAAAAGAPYDEEPAGLGDPARAQSCAPVPIEMPMCVGVSYNSTANYVKQKEVGVFLHQLDELVRLQCAPYLRLFVCSMHLPFCNRDQGLLVRPCQEFCLSVRGLCIPALRKFGYDWPSGLACNSLPLEAVGVGSNRKNLCLRPAPEDFNAAAARLQKDAVGGDKFAVAIAEEAAAAAAAAVTAGPRQHEGEPSESAARWPNASSATDSDLAAASRRLKCSAAELPVGGLDGGWCARRCMASFLFAREDREFAAAWMLGWSVVCFVCTGLALATFALDARRFHYPERPVVWVAACHLVHSGAHLLRAALGPELACSRPSGGDLALVSRHAGQWCAAIFLLLYFSWLAGILWWLALALCWHLSAVRRWGHQLLAERAVWLHLLAWGAPLMLSVVLLVLHRIEGDELTHLCVIDGSRAANQVMFHVAPVGTALVLGLAFLASALRAVVSAGSGAAELSAAVEAPGRQLPPPSSPQDSSHQQRHLQPLRRDPLQQQQRQLQAVKLTTGGASGGLRSVAEQQAAKISLFSFLFVLPTACVLAANVYEVLERHKWTAGLEGVLARPACVSVDGVAAAVGDCGAAARPSVVFYMLKIFMSLTAGLPAGLLVWANGQTADAWRRCLCRAMVSRRRAAKGGPGYEPALHQQQPQHPQQHQQPQQQQIQLHQMSQQHLYQQYQSHSYSTVDSLRGDARVATGFPAKTQHQLVVQHQQQHQQQHQHASVSDV